MHYSNKIYDIRSPLDNYDKDFINKFPFMKEAMLIIFKEKRIINLKLEYNPNYLIFKNQEEVDSLSRDVPIFIKD